MRFGLDIHGVIDRYPNFFSQLTTRLLDKQYEVHVLTGKMIDLNLKNKLKEFNVRYTSLFSITDYHIALGTDVRIDESGNPWIDPLIWDKTKADYCLKNKIHFHIDDSPNYGKFFETPYAFFNYKRKRFEWHLTDKAAGEFLFLDNSWTADNILEQAMILKDNYYKEGI